MTMTSREIADVVESRHDKVKQSIDRLVLSEVISKPPMGDGIKAANGVTEKVYLLGKRDSIIVVAQLCPEFTARLVDRWQELEAALVPTTPQPYTIALPPMTLAEKHRQLKVAQDIVSDEDLKNMFPLIWQTMVDGVQNDIVAMFGGTKLISSDTPQPLDVTEIAKRNGIELPSNLKGSIGKYVKKHSSVAPVQTERLINGSIRKSFAYTNISEVVGLIKEKLGM